MDGILFLLLGWKLGDVLYFELLKREDAGVGAFVKSTNVVAAVKVVFCVVFFVLLDLNLDLDDDDVVLILDDFEEVLESDGGDDDSD